MIIYPEVIVTPDSPTIKFYQSKEQIDLDVELPRILQAQGWGCGTYFHVQFLNHEKTKLESSAKFVVTEEVEEQRTNESNPYQPITKTFHNRKAQMIGDWWYPKEINTSDTGVAKVVWNPGKKVHQVKIGEKVIYEDKDKETALRVASGKTSNAA